MGDWGAKLGDISFTVEFPLLFLNRRVLPICVDGDARRKNSRASSGGVRDFHASDPAARATD